MANEIQEFRFGSTSSPKRWANIHSGSFRFSAFSGELSDYVDIATGNYVAEITETIESLASVGVGDVSVTAILDGGMQTVGMRYEFQNALADTPINQFAIDDNTLRINADTISINMLDNGMAPVLEYHTIDLGGATTGTFDITDGGTPQTVSTLDTTGIQAAYDALYGSGAFTVADQGGGIFIATATSEGGYAAPSTTNNSTDGSPTATQTQPYVAGSGPIFEAWLPDEPDAGTLTLTHDIGTPNTSAEFAWNASTSTIETAIANGGAGPGSTVTGSGTTADPWIIDLSSGLSDPAVNPSYGTEGSTSLTGPCAVEVVTVQEGSSAGYTLDLDGGSYTLSGQSVELTAQRKIDISQGSYTLTGQSVALSKGFTLSLENGSYALTGQAVGLTAQRTIAIATGSYTLTGQELGLTKGFTIAIGQGSYGLTGQDVGLFFGRVLTVNQGSYSLTGQALGLTKGFTIAIGQGSYTLNGQAVGLTAQRRLDIEQGSYSLTGQDVGLARGYALAIGQGSYALTGQDVALLAGRSIAIDTGFYVLSGQDVEFSRTFGLGTPRTTYIARLTTSAPHLTTIATATAHAAAIPGGIETATITSSTPHWARVPRSDYQ